MRLGTTTSMTANTNNLCTLNELFKTTQKSMKKSLFCLVLLTLAAGSIKAQLANTKWKGILKLDDPVNVSFDFGKDTLTVLNLDAGEIIETMTFKATNSTFTLTMVSGQSDCDNSTTGRYSYSINDNTMTITLIEDACEDRGPYLKGLQLTKNTQGAKK